MSFSIDLRERVIAVIDDNMHINTAVTIFKVSRRVIYTWLSLRKKTGNLAPKANYQQGHSHKIKDWDKFRDFAEEFKQNNAAKMITEWKNRTGVDISKSVMYRALKKINYTCKKKLFITSKQAKKNEKNF